MINFWNGNKSPTRQAYELDLLQTILNTQSSSPINIHNDITDYPVADDEGNVFSNGTDVLTTIAGNKKFNAKPTIKIDRPLCKGLLGYRILIIRQQDSEKFSKIDATTLKSLIAGIPATWVDADLFRANQYKVLEQGSLQDILQLLKGKQCDYVSLGANEVHSLFAQIAAPLKGLIIESNIVLQYPFPLVFYVHPDKEELAQDIETGLDIISKTGDFNTLFESHYGDVINKLNLHSRKTINLHNPNISAI